MLPQFSLDHHTARLFLPSERNGPTQVYVEMYGRNFAPRTYAARLARDIAGRERVVMQQEGKSGCQLPCLILRCPRFLHPGDIVHSTKRIVMEVPAGTSYPALFGNMQRAYTCNLYGLGALFSPHGPGILFDLRHNAATTKNPHGFVGDFELDPKVFVDMPAPNFDSLAAQLLEDPTSDCSRTWAFVRSSEDTKCREMFGCSSAQWQDVRQVLRWALICCYAKDSWKEKQVQWLYWLSDDSALQNGNGSTMTMSPLLRAWRDAALRANKCHMPQMTWRDYFVSDSWYEAPGGPYHKSDRKPTPGSQDAFKTWIRPTAIHCSEPDATLALEAKRRVRIWAKERLPATLRKYLLKVTE